jgi:AcrR family transcriptional regulator
VAQGRGEPAREVDRRQRVMEAAKVAIAEQGLGRVRMSHIAKAAGMSPGHILYYFKSKGDLLVHTLLWNEAATTRQRRADLAAIEDAAGRLAHYIAIYIPSGPHDPDWALWLAGYGLVATDPDIFLTVEGIVRDVEDDLTAIVELGIRSGEFKPVDARDFAERFYILLNGYSVAVATGDPRYDHQVAVRRVAQAAAAELGVDPGRLLAE